MSWVAISSFGIPILETDRYPLQPSYFDRSSNANNHNAPVVVVAVCKGRCDIGQALAEVVEGEYALPYAD